MSMMMEQMTRVAVQRSMEEQTPKVPPASERVRDALPRVVVTKDWIIETDKYRCHDGVYRFLEAGSDFTQGLHSFPQVFQNPHLASIGKLLLPPTIKYSHAIHEKNFDFEKNVRRICWTRRIPSARFAWKIFNLAPGPHGHTAMIRCWKLASWFIDVVW